MVGWWDGSMGVWRYICTAVWYYQNGFMVDEQLDTSEMVHAMSLW